VRSVAEKVRRTAASSEQKSDRREISFRRVAQLAREDEIVAPIVGGLAATRSDVIECHCRFGESITAVRTYGPVLLQKPSPRFCIGDASSGMRCELDRPVRRASFGALFSTPTARSGWASTVAMLVFEQLLVRPVMRSRARRGGPRSMMMVRRRARGRAGSFVLPLVAVGRIVMLSRQKVLRLK